MAEPLQHRLFDDEEHQANDPIFKPMTRPVQETVVLILDGEWLFDFYSTINQSKNV